MDFSKLKNKLLIILCVFVVLFPFWCVRGLCAEVEDVTSIEISGLYISTSANYFQSTSDNNKLSYVKMEKGYIYYLNIGENTPSARRVAICEETPALNVTYQFLGSYEPGEVFSYIPSSDTYFLCYSPNNSANVTFTREKLTNMDGAVNELVENVGIQSLWNTFNNANPFLLVVVLFSFGLFIIVVLVRKLRKGKGGF